MCDDKIERIMLIIKDMREYLYIMTNPDWDYENKYKYGYTTNLYGRINTDQHSYISKYLYLWKMEKQENYELYEQSDKIISMGCRDGLYLDDLRKHLVNQNGGTEFIYHSGLELLCDVFDNMSEFNIITTRVTIEEVEKINTQITEVSNYNTNDFIYRDYQKEVLNKAIRMYNTQNKLKLIWACGLGKSITSLLIARHLGTKKIFIGVPSLHLKFQFYEIIQSFGLNCVVETYHSSGKYTDIEFDFAIMDECHHICGTSFKDAWKINAKKYLYMTATEKIINSNNNKLMCMSKDFGNLLDMRSFNWAINNKYITDYNLLLIRDKDRKWENRLSMSVYMTIKAMNIFSDLTHVIIYSNSVEEADKVINYIGYYKTNNMQLYAKAFHSNTISNYNRNQELKNFNNSSMGIISCVYMLGEGFDMPILNGVTFANNMESDIRIVQAAMRPNRLNTNNPNKKSYIIIPYKDNEEDKCKFILNKIRNVDENIEQKISLVYANDSTWSINKQKSELEDGRILKLLLKSSREHNYETEYKKLIMFNIKHNIRHSKDYRKIAKEVGLPINPHEYFGKQIWKGWYKFFGYTPNAINKEDWIKRFGNINIKIKEYTNLSYKDESIPEFPEEIYGISISELLVTKKRRM